MGKLTDHAELLEESIRQSVTLALAGKPGEEQTIEIMAAFITQLVLELKLTPEQVNNRRFWDKLNSAIKVSYWRFLEV